MVQGYGHRGMHGDWDWGWLPMLGLMVALVALLVWLALSASRRSFGAHPGAGAPPPPGAYPSAPRATAEEILAERLARGEIEVDDYHRRLEALRAPKP